MSATKLDPGAAKLFQELREQLDLSEPDALRATFTILAHEKGWTKARIGRYLGVTRHRVHQRIDRYAAYAGNSKTFPVLREHVRNAKRPAKVERTDLPVAFTPEDWNDLNFGRTMINQMLSR